MYKFLIVDDEQIVLNSMTHILNKNFGDQIEIELAKSGFKAIEKAIEFNPDVVFMDINIPGIKGLDVIKELKKVVSNAEYFIISAYDKFSYAKEAIQLGVIDYILKPLNKERLLEITLQAMEKVDENRGKRIENLKLREKAEMFSPIVKENLMYNIMFKEHAVNERARYFELLNLNEHEGYVLIISFSKENIENLQEMMSKINSSISNRLDIDKSIFKSVLGNKLVMFVPEAKKQTDYFDRMISVKFSEKISNVLQTLSEHNYKMGIGSNRKLNDLTLSFDEANRAIILGEKQINYFPDIKNSVSDNSFDIYKYSDKFLEELINTNIEKTELFIDKSYDNLKKQADNKIKLLQSLIIKLFIDIEGHMDKNTNSEPLMANNEIKEILMYENENNIKQFYLKKCRIVKLNGEKSLELSYSGYIKYAINYLNTRYSKEISLEEIAGDLYISPQYLSKLFKEETGKNFIDSLNEIRVKHATELLEKSSKNVKEIAFEVGYNDPNYFSRIFKKWTKFTPKEYRKNINV